MTDYIASTGHLQVAESIFGSPGEYFRGLLLSNIYINVQTTLTNIYHLLKLQDCISFCLYTISIRMCAQWNHQLHPKPYYFQIAAEMQQDLMMFVYWSWEEHPILTYQGDGAKISCRISPIMPQPRQEIASPRVTSLSQPGSMGETLDLVHLLRDICYFY